MHICSSAWQLWPCSDAPHSKLLRVSCIVRHVLLATWALYLRLDVAMDDACLVACCQRLQHLRMT